VFQKIIGVKMLLLFFLINLFVMPQVVLGSDESKPEPANSGSAGVTAGAAASDRDVVIDFSVANRIEEVLTTREAFRLLASNADQIGELLRERNQREADALAAKAARRVEKNQLQQRVLAAKAAMRVEKKREERMRNCRERIHAFTNTVLAMAGVAVSAYAVNQSQKEKQD
jgi:hypothetical protein